VILICQHNDSIVSILRKIIFAKEILHFKVVMHQYNFGWGLLTAIHQFF